MRITAEKSVLPSAEEIPGLIPGPRSITRRRASDLRGFAGAGYALLLQVAHPTVGAGVSEHSDYKSDPWGRLLRTTDFVNSLIYADPDTAAAVGRNVRAMHTGIKGIKPDGTRYHALEPAAYAWVHATLAEAIVTTHEYFGIPMHAAEVETFWAEWRRLGRLLGVRERDLPEGWGPFREYFDETVAGLEHTDAVRDVLETMARPKRPSPLVPRRAWNVGRMPMAHGLSVATIGLLGPELRARFGLRWSRAQELELRAMGRASRSLTPLLPRSVRYSGPSYLRWRSEEVGKLASAKIPRALERPRVAA